MLIKFVAGTVIVLSSFLIGNGISLRYTERTKLLVRFRTAFHQLESYVVYKAIPIPEAFLSLSHETDSCGKFFLENLNLLFDEKYLDLYCGWRSAIETVLAKTPLTISDKTVVDDFGRVLGQANREDHKEYFDLFFMQLNERILESQEMQKKYCKMYRSLGFLTGLIIFIILI